MALERVDLSRRVLAGLGRPPLPSKTIRLSSQPTAMLEDAPLDPAKRAKRLNRCACVSSCTTEQVENSP
jgi:hypothetical protein